MISAGFEGRLPYMTYPEPWRGPPKQPPEFLRPAPKPIPPRYNNAKPSTEVSPPSFLSSVDPPTIRYNGTISATATTPNGTRLAPPSHPIAKYSSPPTLTAPVNLTQHNKDQPVITTGTVDELYPNYRVYPAPPYQSFPPYTSMYPQSRYAPPTHHLLRPPPAPSTFPSAANSLPTPMDTYSSSTGALPTPSSTITSPTFISPPAAFSPPKAPVTIIREKRTPPSSQQQPQLPPPPPPPPAFKVPSGKEGSLKHRILVRPEDSTRGHKLDSQHVNNSNNINKIEQPSVIRTKKALLATSPPRSPKKPPLNNNSVIGNFNKGSLIQLASGEFRRVEDLRTEDFVCSADRNVELRLAESTVVRIEENHSTSTATITLSYNQRRTQIEVEAASEHPYFVFGQGWASCSPERTQQCYGLKVHRLQVGDIIISLTPREKVQQPVITAATVPLSLSSAARSTTIMTTATTTAMTARQLSVSSNAGSSGNHLKAPNSNMDLGHHQRHGLHHHPHPHHHHLPPPPPSLPHQTHPINLQTMNSMVRPMSPESLAARKRRWSAPEHTIDEKDVISSRKYRPS